MRITASELESQLKQGFSLVYLLHGDDLPQKIKAQETIRTEAMRAGITDRERFDVSTGFDWENWYAATKERSLFSVFSERRLWECHLNETLNTAQTIGPMGSKMLIQYIQNAATDIVLLITAPKLDKTAFSSEWFKAIENKGVTLCTQQSTHNKTTFSVFDLIDAISLGSIHKTKCIFFSLKKDIDAVLVLWALIRKVRTLPLDSKLNRSHLLEKAKLIDDMIKGYARGNAWDELYLFCLYLMGVKILDV